MDRKQSTVSKGSPKAKPAEPLSFVSRRNWQNPMEFCPEGYSYSLNVLRPAREDVLPPTYEITDRFGHELAIKEYLDRKQPVGRPSAAIVEAHWFHDYAQCRISHFWATELSAKVGSTLLLFAINAQLDLQPLLMRVDVVDKDSDYGSDFFWLSSNAINQAFEQDRITVHQRGPSSLELQARRQNLASSAGLRQMVLRMFGDFLIRKKPH